MKKTVEVNLSDVKNFVENVANFSFELKVLNQLKNLGFSCRHSGFYSDPNTSKDRQFDIRATLDLDPLHQLYLSVECKNLSTYNPLLVHSVPRKSVESSHNLLMMTDAISVQDKSPSKIFPENDFVGKSLDNVKFNGDGRLVGGDSETYEAYIQAVNASNELLDRAIDRTIVVKREAGNSRTVFGIVVPVLVVPNERLFQAKYSESDEGKSEVIQIDNSNLLLGVTINGKKYQGHKFKISHLEIATLNGLEKILEKYKSFKSMNGFD